MVVAAAGVSVFLRGIRRILGKQRRTGGEQRGVNSRFAAVLAIISKHVCLS